MKQLFLGTAVKYVTSEKETVDGVIIELFPPEMAHVQWAEKNIALARYSEGKEPNTFHLEDQPDEPEKPAPFTPGAKASPEKPTKPARKARPHQ